LFWLAFAAGVYTKSRTTYPPARRQEEQHIASLHLSNLIERDSKLCLQGYCHVRARIHGSMLPGERPRVYACCRSRCARLSACDRRLWYGSQDLRGRKRRDPRKNPRDRGSVDERAVRDLAAIDAAGLPVWAAGVSIRGGLANHFGWHNDPVSVGDLTVERGDIVLADSDGIMVVPSQRRT